MSDKPFDYWDFFIGEARRADSPLYVRLSSLPSLLLLHFHSLL